MFSLHERTQRKACRTVFVLVCAVPTLVTVCWVVYFHRPWQEYDWQQTLENKLHLRANVMEVAAPHPGQRTIAKVRLTNLDSSDALGELHGLKMADPGAVVVHAATIEWSRLPELARLVQIWMSNQEFQTTRWQFRSVKLVRSDSSACEFRNIRVESSIAATNSRQVILQVETADGHKIRLLVKRHSQGTFHVLFDCQQTVVPAWLIAQVIPGARNWGDAKLSGVMELEQGQGTFRGKVDRIDTQGWLDNDLLQTHAQLQFDSLRWIDDRIQSAKGQLETSAGHVHRALLQAVNEQRFYNTETDITSTTEYQPFQRAACTFQLTEEGLTVVGRCSVAGTPDGYLMVADGKPLLSQPAFTNLQTGQLIQIFNPLGKSWLPATREAIRMADELPLPKSATRKK
jgi:hypothetical protein